MKLEIYRAELTSKDFVFVRRHPDGFRNALYVTKDKDSMSLAFSKLVSGGWNTGHFDDSEFICEVESLAEFILNYPEEFV